MKLNRVNIWEDSLRGNKIVDMAVIALALRNNADTALLCNSMTNGISFSYNGVGFLGNRGIASVVVRGRCYKIVSGS